MVMLEGVGLEGGGVLAGVGSEFFRRCRGVV